MGDDQGNDWGIKLVNAPITRRTRSVGDNPSASVLRELVQSTFGGRYHLSKVTTSGSDAQLHAIFTATDGDVNLCMIATGSYVSGSNAGLQNWSTSDFYCRHKSNKFGPALILKPSEVRSEFTKTHTLALPYHIPGTIIDKTEFDIYENKCLEEFHLRCVSARAKGAPFKALLMELMLAGNGATLCDSTLKKLAILAEHHGFCVVLDEIMTGGRTGTMLMLEQKPQEFQKVVRFVTMGKWMGAGLVLISRDEAEREVIDRPNHADRPLSNNLDCTGIVSAWTAVRSLLGNAQLRREAAINFLKVEQWRCWGSGTIIFAPVERDGLCKNLKYRFLPLLEDIDFERVRVKKKYKELSKGNINNAIMESIGAWIDHGPTAITAELGASLGGDKMRARAIYLLIQRFLKSTTPGDTFYFPKKDIAMIPKDSEGIPNKIWKKAGAYMLNLGLFSLDRLGGQRIETYFTTNLMMPAKQLFSLGGAKKNKNNGRAVKRKFETLLPTTNFVTPIKEYQVEQKIYVTVDGTRTLIN